MLCYVMLLYLAIADCVIYVRLYGSESSSSDAKTNMMPHDAPSCPIMPHHAPSCPMKKCGTPKLCDTTIS